MEKITFENLTCTQRQQLVSKFLVEHPLRLQNSLVEYVLQQNDYDNAPFTREDITNDSPTANIELSDQWVDLTESQRGGMLEELQEKFDDLYGDIEDIEEHPEKEKIQALQADIETLEDTDDFDTYPEIYQWFSCSDWLVRELEDRGECTLDNEYWGRQCCGQSVVLDHVMQEIAFHWFTDYNCDYLTSEKLNELTK